MNIEELDFENELSDEEAEEMLESVLDLIAEQAEEEDNKTSTINPRKIKAVMCAYQLIKHFLKGTKAKVTYELHKPYKSMGSVTIEGKNLMFNDSDWFAAAVKLSSNFNVYPKTNGSVRMDFTFHGLTTPLE